MSSDKNDDPLSAIGFGRIVVPTSEDNEDKLERRALTKGKADWYKEIAEDLRDYRALRKEYGKKVFRLLVCWCVAVAVVVVLQGWGIAGFKLSTAAITTLLGGTTVSVVGLVGFIVQGLFPKSQSINHPPPNS